MHSPRDLAPKRSFRRLAQFDTFRVGLIKVAARAVRALPPPQRRPLPASAPRLRASPALAQSRTSDGTTHYNLKITKIAQLIPDVP